MKNKLSLVLTLLFALTLSIYFYQLSSQKHFGPTNDMFEAADLEKGKDLIIACTACHSLEKNGPQFVGPNLFDIVGSPIAAKAGYEYSTSLLEKKGQYWTIENLSIWLQDPHRFAKNTKMSFGGLLDPQDRMDLIFYLKEYPNLEKP